MTRRITLIIAVITVAFTGALGARLEAQPKSLGLVDLNQASVRELMQVPGMTDPWAARIVRFRPYRTKLDLVQLGVITPEVYQRIRGGVVAHRPPAGMPDQGKQARTPKAVDPLADTH